MAKKEMSKEEVKLLKQEIKDAKANLKTLEKAAKVAAKGVADQQKALDKLVARLPA
jgi:5-bromo-4-chloroindolyl phosphate hydrolysis protein